MAAAAPGATDGVNDDDTVIFGMKHTEREGLPYAVAPPVLWVSVRRGGGCVALLTIFGNNIDVYQSCDFSVSVILNKVKDLASVSC